MPNSRNTGKDWRNYGLLGLFLLLAYLPLSSFLFALKNDALGVNFPNKYFFSAALHAGTFPAWNPYVDFGLPLYADPGFAFWHPLTWLFGAIGYNVYMLTVEVLVYIWLGGVFMYRLGIHLGLAARTAFLMAAMYMCCGFFVGNLQYINFLTSAAFLPLCTLYFLRLQQKGDATSLLRCSVAMYLFIAGGHPALPIGAIYFFAAILAGLIWVKVPGEPRPIRSRIFKTNGLLIVCILGLSAPLLLSGLELFPWFNRAEPVNQLFEQGSGFTFTSWLSFLFPFGTTARSGIFGTATAMRNGYFSLAGLAIFVLALLRPKNKHQLVFLAGGGLMLLLSLGGPIKTGLYSFLPLLQYIRTNGEFRLFALFSFIIVLSYPLNDLLGNGHTQNQFRKILIAIAGISVGVIVVTTIFVIRNPSFTSSAPGTGFTARMKWGLDNLTLHWRFLLNAVIIGMLILLYLLAGKRLNPAVSLSLFIGVDLVISSWLVLPVTGVQKMSPGEIQSLLALAPPGIPIPSLTSISMNRRPGKQVDNIIGCWPYYSKQPGTPGFCGYPTMLTTTQKYFQSPFPDSINRHAFVFLEKAPPATPLKIGSFSPTRMEFYITTDHPDTLVLLQNAFPGWQVRRNDSSTLLQTKYYSFMAAPLVQGDNHLVFTFAYGRLAGYLAVSLATLLILLVARYRRIPTSSDTSSHSRY